MLQSLHMAGTRRGENVCTLTEAAGCDVAGMGLAEFSYGEPPAAGAKRRPSCTGPAIW